MGLFDKPSDGFRNLKELFDGRPFRILSAGTREVETVYGPGTAVVFMIDRVGHETFDPPQEFSGFSAGILQMVRQSDPADFPTWARIADKQLSQGRSTRVLTPVSEDDLASLGGMDDDDIPFS